MTETTKQQTPLQSEGKGGVLEDIACSALSTALRFVVGQNNKEEDGSTNKHIEMGVIIKALDEEKKFLHRLVKHIETIETRLTSMETEQQKTNATLSRIDTHTSKVWCCFPLVACCFYTP